MSNSSVEISIVVPVYNSSPTIHELVSRIQAALSPLGITYEILLTDDCSTDDSWLKISNECQSHRNVIGLRLSQNYGQWFSTLAGLSASSGRYIVTLDDDLEYNPEDIVKLHNAILNSAHLVIFGSAKNKYELQGKNLLIYKCINAFLDVIWNSQPRVSFKMISRKLLFNENVFIVKEPIDTFIARHVTTDLWRTIQVTFDKRFSGKSNYSFSKKVKLFFIYSSYISSSPSRWIAFFSVLFFLVGFGGFYLAATGYLYTLSGLAIGVSLLFIVMIDLYYILMALIKPAQSSLYSITELIRREQ